MSNRFASLVCQPAVCLDIINATAEGYDCVDKATGEITHWIKSGKGFKVVLPDGFHLTERFRIQSILRLILPDFRVAHCQRTVQSKTAHVCVHRSKEHETAFYSGLQTCASVWVCPPCAAKISERRRSIAEQAVEQQLASGGSVSFATRTVPHTDRDSLVSIRDQYRKADTILKRQRGYRKLMKSLGVVGSIKVYEITAGLNGWHMHIHELYFHESGGIDLKMFEDDLYSLWKASAVKAGFSKPSRRHGCQIQDGNFAAAYIAKFGKEPESTWRVDAEITKQHIKKSKSGFSPFDLIKLYDSTGDDTVKNLIIEYAKATKGQRQLIWSRGLKALFNIEDQTDVEIANEQETGAVVLGLISYEAWQVVLKAQARARILILARGGDWSVVEQYLLSIGVNQGDLIIRNSGLPFDKKSLQVVQAQAKKKAKVDQLIIEAKAQAEKKAKVDQLIIEAKAQAEKKARVDQLIIEAKAQAEKKAKVDQLIIEAKAQAEKKARVDQLIIEAKAQAEKIEANESTIVHDQKSTEEFIVSELAVGISLSRIVRDLNDLKIFRPDGYKWCIVDICSVAERLG